MAKAAIHAGIAILMKRMAKTVDDIDRLVIAGAFGNYINAENARTIGMYPELPIEKIIFVGNAAGTGARMGLISAKARQRAEEISNKVKYLELSIDKDFVMEYSRSMYLPYIDSNKFPMTKKLLRKLR